MPENDLLNADIYVLRQFLTGVKAGKKYLEEDKDYMRGLLEAIIEHA